jgi:deazaflavin-dependent oxidoreductase (nitroreductase family)
MPGPLVAAFTGLGRLAYRLMGDRMRVQGRPLLILETVGARSGRARSAILGWFPAVSDTAGESWLVVASYGGAARHPAWYLNLARNPDKVWVQVGDRKVKVRPESLKGAERARAWERVVQLAPGYAGYQEKTDRVIPIVRLTAV